MAIADVIAQLTAKVRAKDQALVVQAAQSALEQLCLAYSLDLTTTPSGLFDGAGNPQTIKQAMTTIAQTVAPLRVQQAVLATLQDAVSDV